MEAITQEILDLMQAFAARRSQPTDVFAIPSLFWVGPELHRFTRAEDVTAFFEQVERFKAKTGWAYSQVQALKIVPYRTDAVSATVTWGRYRADGTYLQAAPITYTLAKLPEGWRVLVAIRNEPGVDSAPAYHPAIADKLLDDSNL